MKTLNDLKTFVRDNLIDDLRLLERDRKKVANKILGFSFLVILIGGILIYFVGFGRVLQVVIALTVAGISGIYYYVSKDYRKKFKEQIIQPIIHFIDPILVYSSTNYISKNLYLESKLFKQYPTTYKGDDHVAGKIGETSIEFSELDTKYTTGTGKNRHTVTIFKGLFFTSDFPKKFKTETFVLPDTAEKLFGFLGKKLQSWNKSRGDLIRLEDPEFEKEFVVYGESQVESRYILSTSLMKRILDFKKKTGRNIYLSFVNNRMNLAVSFKKNLFEPRIFRTVIKFEPIQEYFENLQLMIGIVDDLNLNTRIWK